eukprot:sb/3479111/
MKLPHRESAPSPLCCSSSPLRRLSPKLSAECVVPEKSDGYILTSDNLQSTIKRTVSPGTYAVMVRYNLSGQCSDHSSRVLREKRELGQANALTGYN